MGVITVKQAPDPTQFEKNEPSTSHSVATVELNPLDCWLNRKTAKQLIRRADKILFRESNDKSCKRPLQNTPLFTRNELDMGKTVVNEPCQKYVIETVHPHPSSRVMVHAMAQLYKEELRIAHLRHRNIIRWEGCSRGGYHSMVYVLQDLQRRIHK